MNIKPEKRITILDVCRAAGVSASTVSNVINNRPEMSETTRKRVLSVIQEMNFTPTSSARNLSRRRTDTIGVVLPFFIGFPGRFFYGVQERLRQSNIYTLAIAVRFEYGKIYGEARRLIDERRVDGIIIFNHLMPENEVRELKRSTVPIVTCDRMCKGARFSTVMDDNFHGGYEATRHLIDHGYQNIAILTGDLAWESANGRFQGYKAALADTGMAVDEKWIVPGTWHQSFAEGDWSRPYDLEPLAAQFQKTGWPQAVFCSNDWMALSLLKFVRSHKDPAIRKTAVIGFDGSDQAQAAGLTTVTSSIEDFGKTAASTILEILSDKERRKAEPVEKIVPVRLVRRSSCGCVAAPGDEAE